MLDDVIQWRRTFHQHPELEFNTHQTAEMVSSLLNSFGLEVHQQIGQTGVVAVLRKGNSERAIGLRADMDALPIQEQTALDYSSTQESAMHACGHDGHMAMLLGAARALSTSDTFSGTVYFIFQPNEERGLGAQAMIDDGLFDRFPMDAVYGMHNMPGIDAGKLCMKSGPIMAAEDNFKIVIKGIGGHSSQPHHCVDAITIGAEVVTALQTIRSRTLDPFEPAVVSITEFKSNGQVNVIASEVEITGDCRSFDESVQDKIATQMQSLVSSICKAHGAEFEFEYSKVFYPTINSERETDLARQAALSVNDASKVDIDCAAKTASEDFASMLRVKPGAYIFIGNGLDSEGGCMLHNAHYDFNDAILETGIRYWIALVEHALTKG